MSEPKTAVLEILNQGLKPLAAALTGHSDRIADAVDPDNTALSSDTSKLREASRHFEKQINVWFSIDSWTESGMELGEFLRDSRHSARNCLNHIFGPAQFIAIDPAGADFADEISEITGSAEACLTLIKQCSDVETVGSDRIETHIPKTTEVGHLLIADDDPENREILARLLRPQGHELEFAENGKIALEKIQSIDFDAVFLDIRMPELDGFGVLEALHESGQLRHTPVIVVSGLQEEKDAVRCIEIGAEDFLSRPIRPALLMARLNASLEKKRLREKVFEQHFTAELARELARNPDPMKMQARNAEVTVLFCDIRGFSTISERLGPAQTIDWLSGVMGEFSSSVIENGGVLVDYTGDELMAMWGAPNQQPDHAELACNAALEIAGKLDELNEMWEPIVKAKTLVGIGVNTGEALVGNIGTHRKFKYGPLGTTVNLGSRVQGATKYLKTPLLVTGATKEQLSWGFNTRRLCSVRVQNIKEPVELFEIAPPCGNGWETLRDSYEEALGLVESGNFRQASAILGKLLVAHPNDGPSLQLMHRVVEAMLADGEEFDPIWELPGK